MKNINTMEQSIANLKKEYARIIEIAQQSALTQEQRLAYYSAENRYSAAIDCYEQAIESGLEEGLERGMEKGMEKGKIETARALLAQGVSIDILCNATGLSKEDIIN